jgi:prepilin-type N-terminal cleavage/methylation domain-containing protein
MRLKSVNPATTKRHRSGFTLIEVLAALMFMVIVIPVTMEGLRIASAAGEVGQRKMIAARIGNKVLNELKVAGTLYNSSQTGNVVEHGLDFRWAVKCQAWKEDTHTQMFEATVTVTFLAQGRDYNVSLSTLVPPPQQITSGNESIGIY